MKKTITLISAVFVCSLLLFAPETAKAGIAYPYPIEFTQPDGSRITILLKGDEKVKWAETMDGYSILFNSKGTYEYAMPNNNGDMVPSGIQAREIADRTATDRMFLSTTRKSLCYSQSQVGMMKSIWNMRQAESTSVFPTTGNRKLVCILIGYTDRAFTKTQAEFNNLFNQIGYSAGGATGSVKDYYLETSYNQFNLTVTVAGPYTAAHDLNYYGENTGGQGTDIRPRELVTEAVNLADPDVNYADFDNDNDGTVDGVYVIYAGYNEGAGAPANTIWYHSWSIPAVTLDGKSVSKYACSSELDGTSGTTINGIGGICHEFGHVLGALDFYDTDYATGGQYGGTGHRDVMGSGNWNNSSRTPAHHNPYTKTVVYGWATAATLNAGSHITLNNSTQNSNSFYRYNTPTANEYFLIENKQQIGFDASVPGHGMIVYHVDGNYIAGAGNAINAGIHQGMYPVCANATGNPPTTYGLIDTDGCPFPGTGGITSFTDATTPNSHSWAGASTGLPINKITENTGTHQVSFCSGDLAAVSVSIATGSATVCANTSVQFNATGTNGGGSAFYDWKINGLTVVSGYIPTVTFVGGFLANNDVVSVTLTSSDYCVTGSPATSNPITMTVRPAFTAGSIPTTGETICNNGDPMEISVASLEINNGTIVNSFGTGAGGADESTYFQGGIGTYGSGMQLASGISVMDDFVVSSNFTIKTAKFLGYQTNSTTSSTFTGLYFRIYDGVPGAGGNVIWGDFVTNRMTSTSFANIYRVITAYGGVARPMMNIVCSGLNISLAPGTYWIEWAATGSLASGPWVPCTTSPTGNAMQNLGSGPSQAFYNGSGIGFPFILQTDIGTVTDASGGDNVITYRWQSSATVGFGLPVNINHNATSYDPPAGLTTTTWYRRQAHDGTCNTGWETSGGVWKVTVDVDPPIVDPKVAGSVTLDPFGNYTLLPSDVMNSWSDDGVGIESIVMAPADIHCADLGPKMITVTVTDFCGNATVVYPVITVVEGTALPPPFVQCIIGASNGTGIYTPCTGNGRFTLTSTGNSSPYSDVHESVYQPLTGNGYIVARVYDLSGGGWAGVQIRESCSPGSKKVLLKTQLQPLIRSEIRNATGGASISTQILRQGIKWLKLARVGNRFDGYTSVDGTSWRLAFSTTVTMTNAVQIGILSEGINFTSTTQARFDHVVVTAGVKTLEDGNLTFDPKPDNQVEIYPNPATNEVNISIPANESKVKLMVTTLEGKVLQTMEFSGSETRLDISRLEPGVYLIRFETNNEFVTKRLVVL